MTEIVARADAGQVLGYVGPDRAVRRRRRRASPQAGRAGHRRGRASRDAICRAWGPFISTISERLSAERIRHRTPLLRCEVNRHAAMRVGVAITHRSGLPRASHQGASYAGRARSGAVGRAGACGRSQRRRLASPRGAASTHRRRSPWRWNRSGGRCGGRGTLRRRSHQRGSTRARCWTRPRATESSPASLQPSSFQPFAQYTDQARQVELGVLAAEADAGAEDCAGRRARRCWRVPRR